MFEVAGSNLECHMATPMFSGEGSMDVTFAPSLARDSDNNPPPQPTSRILRSFRCCSSNSSFLCKISATHERTNPTLTGFISCNGPVPALEVGSHQSLRHI